jgi:ferritin-like metal-binding protein YciE
MTPKTPKSLNTDVLKHVFVHNLNRIYFGKCYLDQHLGHLTTVASFDALKLAIEEFWGDIKKQIERMEAIYELIGEKPSDKNCNPIRSIIKDNFCLGEDQESPILTDVNLISCLQLLEHINIIACNMLKIIAKKLNMNEGTQLLTECFDESIDNDHLFTLIFKEYINVD